MTINNITLSSNEVIWSDKKRTIFGLPLSFTTYTLTSKKLLIDTGFFTQTREEVMLFRISDITVKRSLIQRLFGLGTIHCCSADQSTPEFDIACIANSAKVGEKLSQLVEEQRKANNVETKEVYSREGHTH